MTSPCAEAAEWLARMETGLGVENVVVEASQLAHLATCATCQERYRREQAWVLSAQDALTYHAGPAQEQAFLHAISAAATEPPADAALRALDHEPGEAAELRFMSALQAARGTRAPPPTPKRNPGWGWVGAVALAAAVLCGIALWSASAPEPVPPIPPVDRPVALDPPAPSPTVADVQGEEPESLGAVAERSSPPSASSAPSVRASGVARIDGKPAPHLAVRPVRSGMTIATEAGAQLVISDPANATLTVSEHAAVRVEAWSKRLTRVALQAGTVGADVVHRDGGERFEILTNNARVVVVGTVFTVSYAPHTGTVVRGTSGRVRVEDLDGQVLGIVGAGQRLAVAPDPALDPGDRARQLLAAGDEPGAIAVLLAQEPGDWRRDSLLGDAYVLTGDFVAAEAAYRDAISGSSTAPEAVYLDLAAVQQQRLGRLGAAEATWRAYLNAYPNGAAAARAHLWLVERRLAAGRPDEARPHVDVLLARHSPGEKADIALTKLGAYHLANRRWGAAESLLEPHESDRSTRGEMALIGLARVDLALGRFRSAKARITEAEQRFPNGARSDELARLKAALEGRR